MNIFVNLLINGLAVFITAYLLPGVRVSDFVSAIIVGVVLGFLNTFLRPVLLILTLPITVVTLGIFALIINGIIIMLAGSLVPGFYVANIGWAIIFGLVLTIISWFLNSLKSE